MEKSCQVQRDPSLPKGCQPHAFMERTTLYLVSLVFTARLPFGVCFTKTSCNTTQDLLAQKQLRHHYLLWIEAEQWKTDKLKPWASSFWRAAPSKHPKTAPALENSGFQFYHELAVRRNSPRAPTNSKQPAWHTTSNTTAVSSSVCSRLMQVSKNRDTQSCPTPRTLTQPSGVFHPINQVYFCPHHFKCLSTNVYPLLRTRNAVSEKLNKETFQEINSEIYLFTQYLSNTNSQDIR